MCITISISGKGKNHLTLEMENKTDKIFEEKLKGSGLKFQSYVNLKRVSCFVFSFFDAHVIEVAYIVMFLDV